MDNAPEDAPEGGHEDSGAGAYPPGGVIRDVYRDAGRPAMRVVGEMAADVARGFSLLLAPFRVGVAAGETARHLLTARAQARVANALRDRGVPPARVVAPSPRVALPALRGLLAAEADDDRAEPLRAMYAGILAESMAPGGSSVHPGFAHALDQMTSDEARIVGWLAAREAAFCYYVELGAETGSTRVVVDDIWTVGADARCERPDLVPAGIGNLGQLGLTTFTPDRHWAVELRKVDISTRHDPPAARPVDVLLARVRKRRVASARGGPGADARAAFADLEHVLTVHPDLVSVLAARLLGPGAEWATSTPLYVRRRRTFLTHRGRQFCAVCVGPPEAGTEAHTS